jgi:hypothetical protein
MRPCDTESWLQLGISTENFGRIFSYLEGAGGGGAGRGGAVLGIRIPASRKAFSMAIRISLATNPD